MLFPIRYLVTFLQNSHFFLSCLLLLAHPLAVLCGSALYSRISLKFQTRCWDVSTSHSSTGRWLRILREPGELAHGYEKRASPCAHSPSSCFLCHRFPGSPPPWVPRPPLPPGVCSGEVLNCGQAIHLL